MIAANLFRYYMIELSFYWSLLFFQFMDTRRKDFWQMLAHHIVTLLLIHFSWITNFVRIGTLIMLLHDFADIFLDVSLPILAKFSCRVDRRANRYDVAKYY